MFRNLDGKLAKNGFQKLIKNKEVNLEISTNFYFETQDEFVHISSFFTSHFFEIIITI